MFARTGQRRGGPLSTFDNADGSDAILARPARALWQGAPCVLHQRSERRRLAACDVVTTGRPWGWGWSAAVADQLVEVMLPS
ncbi:MAG: hypothetical protein ACRDTK_11175, partial [Mycobacterium sp.]